MNEMCPNKLLKPYVALPPSLASCLQDSGHFLSSASDALPWM